MTEITTDRINTDVMMLGRLDAQAARHASRLTDDGEMRIVVLPPEGHGELWAGSAR